MWGIVALCVGALAVMGANMSAMVPQSILAGLHKTRLEGATLDQLRVQVASLREETSRLQRENGVLATRFTLDQQQGNDVVQRVGAIEMSLPKLLEALPVTAQIDRSAFTGSVSTSPALVYEADGGSVVVRQQPMAGTQVADVAAQALPAALPQIAATALPDEAAFGIAVGPSVAFEQAPATWTDLSVKLGPLLFGLSPLLVDEANGEEKRIVVGPITQLSEATSLCQRLERVSISCMPMPFTGTPLDY